MTDTKKLEVQDYVTETKKPNQLVILKRIEKLIAELDGAGLAYLKTRLAEAPKQG